MANYHFHLPIDRDLDDLVDAICAVAPGSSGFDTGELRLVIEGIPFAETAIRVFGCEVTRSRDQAFDAAAQIWINASPSLLRGIEAAITDLGANIEAFRVVHLDADRRHFEAIQKVFADV
jgi:hypothetical protein